MLSAHLMVPAHTEDGSSSPSTDSYAHLFGQSATKEGLSLKVSPLPKAITLGPKFKNVNLWEQPINQTSDDEDSTTN